MFYFMHYVLTLRYLLEVEL
jgi:hypothetical protein